MVFSEGPKEATRWQTIPAPSAGSNGNITSARNYQRIQDYLDVVNFADYMLLHFYADSEDWPHHNGYAAANAVSGDGKYRFWCWDQEIVLDKYSWNRYGDSRGVGSPFQRLRQRCQTKTRDAIIAAPALKPAKL